MRIALLSAASSVHTRRWADALSATGVEVHLISAHPCAGALDRRVHFHQLRFPAPAGYVLNAIVLRRMLADISPDLLNTHFASGYGLLARLTHFRPHLLSVWGTDVYEFPMRSYLHRAVLRANLRAATAIGSTSDCMARQVERIYEHPHIFITPFGVDTERFGDAVTRIEGGLTIGTVKTLHKRYGVDTLILAFSELKKRLPSGYPARLEITGDGPERSPLLALVDRLGLSGEVTFHGAVTHERVPEMLHRLDIYVALSRFESFGVAILEAASCGKPVVVSDAEGPMEVTLNEQTGLIVRKDDPAAAADALSRLVLNTDLRMRMGAAGRRHVLENYNWKISVDRMLRAFERTIALGPAAPLRPGS